MTVKKQNGVFVFVFLLAWPSQYVFLLPHIPLIGQGGSIILVLYSMNVHWPTILYFLWQLWGTIAFLFTNGVFVYSVLFVGKEHLFGGTDCPSFSFWTPRLVFLTYAHVCEHLSRDSEDMLIWWRRKGECVCTYYYVCIIIVVKTCIRFKLFFL